MKHTSSGVTLIELMVVIVIVAVLASIALPSYRNYVTRAQRTDATAALLRVASAQEKFYLQNNRYAEDAEVAAAPPAGLGIAGTESGFYAIAVESDDPAVDFTATATPIAGEGQQDDDACARFQINERGTREAFTSANAANTELCWR